MAILFLISISVGYTSPDFTFLPGYNSAKDENIIRDRIFITPAHPVGCYNPVEPSGKNTSREKINMPCQKKQLASRGASWSSRVIRTAMKFIGVPYRWGGAGWRGFDCSGFVMRVFAKHGIKLGHDAFRQFAGGSRVLPEQLAPGDLVFFSTYAPGPTHVGIYIGNGKFIHASSSQGIIISNLSDPYFKCRYIGARRY
ncbi:MAG: C40 family peptidase [Candidatus Eremiobacteraeota bacterium]|nr:C40 family peptidase [Candidatus Eremiobacteraeota bacterium]